LIIWELINKNNFIVRANWHEWNARKSGTISTECSGGLPLMHQCVFYRWTHIPNVKKPVLFGNRRVICQIYDWMANYNHKFLTEENIRYFKLLKCVAIQILVKPSQSKIKILITYNDSFWSLLYTQPLPHPPPQKKTFHKFNRSGRNLEYLLLSRAT
jgi:hypothetical protein